MKFTDTGYVLVRAVGVGVSAEGHVVHLTVEDTGIGIAPENQEHVFAEFRQVEEAANRRFEGTGLGLAITRRIISLMGGKMWVESELGVGVVLWRVAGLAGCRCSSGAVCLAQTHCAGLAC